MIKYEKGGYQETSSAGGEKVGAIGLESRTKAQKRAAKLGVERSD